jgi:hypothetical protein
MLTGVTKRHFDRTMRLPDSCRRTTQLRFMHCHVATQVLSLLAADFVF